jgi:hypothetical protein
MMTHGWRKYDWSKIVKGEYPQIQYPRDSSYFTLSGEVSGISKKKIEAAKSLFVVIKGVDSSVQNQIIPINEGGGFDGKNILLFDSTTIYYRLSGMKGIANYIKLKLNQSEVLPVFKGYSIARNTPVYAPNNTQAANNQRLSFFMTKESDVKAHQLADVQVITHMKTQIEKMDDLYVNNPVFKGSGAMRSYTFDIEHDKTAFGYGNIFSYLAGRVPPEPPGGNDATYYFLNEVNLGNDMHAIEAVNEVNINEIAYVRVFPAPFVGAPMNGSAIVIYTKKGNDIDAQPENTPFITTKGYTSLKEFYQPNYSNKDSSKLEEDIRKTIYWNPILLTNKNANKIRLAFYNNDVTSAFRVVLEGMDNEGKLTHTEQIIE